MSGSRMQRTCFVRLVEVVRRRPPMPRQLGMLHLRIEQSVFQLQHCLQPVCQHFDRTSMGDQGSCMRTRSRSTWLSLWPGWSGSVMSCRNRQTCESSYCVRGCSMFKAKQNIHSTGKSGGAPAASSMLPSSSRATGPAMPRPRPLPRPDMTAAACPVTCSRLVTLPSLTSVRVHCWFVRRALSSAVLSAAGCALRVDAPRDQHPGESGKWRSERSSRGPAWA